MRLKTLLVENYEQQKKKHLKKSKHDLHFGNIMEYYQKRNRVN